MATKKSSDENAEVRRAVIEGATSEESAGKPPPKETVPDDITPPEPQDEFPGNVTCMCMQKRKNGKFFSFTLQQGRWVQSSAFPFPTKELCEDANC